MEEKGGKRKKKKKRLFLREKFCISYLTHFERWVKCCRKGRKGCPKQNKTKQNKTKQNKTKKNETKPPQKNKIISQCCAVSKEEERLDRKSPPSAFFFILNTFLINKEAFRKKCLV